MTKDRKDQEAQLEALSPLDGRYKDQLTSLSAIFCEKNLQKMRVKVEIEWLIFLTEKKVLPYDFKDAEKKRLRQIYQGFDRTSGLEIKALEATTRHDVKAVELFLRQVYPKDLPPQAIQGIHFGMTSEDTNSFAYSYMWQDWQRLCLEEMQQLQDQLKEQAKAWIKIAMVSRTHGQLASPTTLGKEWLVFYARLKLQKEALAQQKIWVKFSGATGNYSAWQLAFPEQDWQALTQQFIERAGFSPQSFTTQIEPHDFLAEIFHSLLRWNTIALDLAKDVWGYIALRYFDQKRQEGQVGSSTMPHKINPIDFENAEGNLGLANAMLGFMAEKLPISRWQRDLSDSTVLRSAASALGYSLLGLTSLKKGLAKISPNLQVIEDDLKNAWEVLLEPVQTLMRLSSDSQQLDQSWQKFSGKKLGEQEYLAYVRSLPLPEVHKNKLLVLRPEAYVGNAADRKAEELEG